MIRPIITLRRKRIIVDVDTQNDFFLAKGQACIRNHRRVLANIRRVIAWARLKNIRMISTAQVYDGADPDYNYCVAGTAGQKKIRYTIRNRYVVYPADGCTDLPRDILQHNDQIILHKRCIDPFEEPRADRMLSELRVNEFILIGATVEGALKATALGLLARKKAVTVLVDATGARDRQAAEIALRQVEAKGAKLADTKALLGPSCLKLIGICDCDRCQGRMVKASLGTNNS
ncbi:MAG: isochorismatase family protein [Planctomycetes bacterium]|nr:isochorismatase family protein [Planctomycetota bacterium]